MLLPVELPYHVGLKRSLNSCNRARIFSLDKYFDVDTLIFLVLVFDDDILGASEVDLDKDVCQSSVVKDKIVDEFDITSNLISFLL